MTVSIRPFKAFRPDEKWVEEVVLPTFDNLTEKQLDNILKKSKYNFLNVVSPEAFYPNISKKNSRRHASQHLKEMIDNEVIFQDSSDCFYVYCLHKYGKKQFGIVASVNVKKKNNNILKHEDIYVSKANSILKTIENTKMQVGPVYLSYKEKTNLNRIYSKYRKKKPLYKFKTPGGTERSLWKVDNLKDIKFINKNLSLIKNFYIADGHHRFAAMEQLCKKKNVNSSTKKDIPLLAAIFDNQSVNILSFHRLVKIKNFNKDIFFNSLKEVFPEIKLKPFKFPKSNGELMIYIKNKWYFIDLRKNKKIYSKYETDTEVVEKVVIKNIIKKNIKFKLEKLTNVPGKYDHRKLVKDVNAGLADIGFFICPIKMKKIIDLADKGKIVPKKSTYFDPKPADGLVNLLNEYIIMEKPNIKPYYPYFSSGPCAKPPGWSLDKLKNATLSRSHRSKIAKDKLEEVINKSKDTLGIPKEYYVGIVPASDTGAVEMAMWCMLGQRGVEVYSWENFGHDWATDIGDQLPIENKIVQKAEYGSLPDFSKSNPDNDIIFTWNGTTGGTRIKNTDWISDDRKGLVICDATSAVFSMKMDWEKLDVVTYSWQKVLGSEAAHGMLILSPRAVERLESYTPPWPIPKIFRLAKNQKFSKDIFSGTTINTPSMLCVEDVLNSLNWAESVGGINELIKISERNLEIVTNWIEKSETFKFLAKDPETVSCTSICIMPKDKWFTSLDDDAKVKFMKEVCSEIEKNEAGYDLNSYKTAPPGIRIWGGSTVENENVEKVLPWIDWAYNSVKENYRNE